MKKQSSIEWIEGYLKKFNHINESLALKKAFEKAKQMHKQEIIEAWENGYTHGASANDEPSIYHGTQYYKNTYEKEN